MDLSRAITRHRSRLELRACDDDGRRVYFWRNVKWDKKYFLKRQREAERAARKRVA